ncbi:YeeE/YedE family protein [Aromatoleum bremense]|uniref:YeeE/YedE family protein n=1 Tax=Aromatoleum bremense TaxID=76115 RepID=A0ABX1NWE3_9RHOO|nr:YeeE/YedE family protein [Aromatoleum bremense]NMG16098.1 YeeE/YedE family protein [Aromatoleum bremense]QTQ30212.1 sulfur transport domain-containing protein [Aromatoleum bremense]
MTSANNAASAPAAARLGGALAWIALAAAVGAAAYAASGPRHLALYAVGVAIGAVLLRSEFGFTGSLRRFVIDRDRRALRAPLALLGLTTLALAPALAQGELFGQPLGPAAAPVALQVAAGALLFGVGMQLAGGCGSGTLFSLGGGNGRMLVVIVFFCAGSFVASLHMGWWAALPAAEPIVLGERFGWLPSAVFQLGVIGALWVWAGRRQQPAADHEKHGISRMGPALVALALLNLATLLLAGHPWTITWAYALWGAKAATWVGWDPAGAAFWQAPFQSAALARGVLDDVTSLMDIGLVLGAGGAALAAGRWTLRFDRRPGTMLAAVLGGVLMGYGARIGFGCTVGALLSGVASTSVHGWLWLAAVLPGTWLGGRLRPRFGL